MDDAMASPMSHQPQNMEGLAKPKTGVITFLQTTDVYCQLHVHDELFWENSQLTFRKTGGYAHIATALVGYPAERKPTQYPYDRYW
jgi:S-sulfosulfanyl-L-cysteine sulfohydrolase